MEENIEMQAQLQSLTSKAAHIEKMLERGANTVILQLGSHSLKYGLANDTNPRWLRCLVGRKIQESDRKIESCAIEPDADKVGHLSELVEAYLTKKGNIKRQDGSFNKTGKPKGAAKTEPARDRFEFQEKVTDFSKDLYLGEEVYYLEGRKDFVVREPIQFGLLNIANDYTENDAINDLELLIQKAVSDMEIPAYEIENYSLVICAPDKFHRGQMKLIIDMLMERIGFGTFSIHLESILASFGCGLPLVCIIEMGYTSITVTTVEEGVIVPNSQIKKHYGARDIDILLNSMLNYSNQVTCIPDTSRLSIRSFKHLAALEKLREKYGIYCLAEETNKIADFYLPAELNEPTKLCVPFNNSFIVAPSMIFHVEGLELLHKDEAYKEKPQFDRNSAFFEGYLDEEDFQDDTEIRVNKMMAQCLQTQDLTKKQQILDSSKIDMSSIQLPYSMANLEDIISYSIFQLKDAEARKKAANCIVISGGFARTPFLVEELEDRLIERIAKFDPNIDRVEVINHSNREFDNAELVWTGGAVLPKLDCMRDSFISKNRWLARIDTEEERDRRERKDCAEFGIKYLKEKIAFQW
jgi:actin-related protein 8